MDEIKIVIPINPVTKKNSQQIFYNRQTRRPFITTSEAYKHYEYEAGFFIKPLGINTPVTVECKFYMQTRRKVDLTNLLESIDDILVKCGALEDDNYKIIASHDGSRVYYDKENPRTEIVIKDFKE